MADQHTAKTLEQAVLMLLRISLNLGLSVKGVDPSRFSIYVDQHQDAENLRQRAAHPNNPTGMCCSHCGGAMEAKGTCLYCTSCGESNGCS